MKSSVYKYFPSKHINNVTSGCLRINTFSGIRKGEVKNLEIQDLDEGIVTNNSGEFHIPDINDPKYQGKAQNFKNFMPSLTITGNTEVIIKDSISISEVPDAYMYCTTKQRNDEYWKQLKFENYDACIEIYNYKVFCERIIRAIYNFHYQYYNLNHESALCVYADTKGNLEYGNVVAPNYFLKHGKYAIEKEVRLVVRLADLRTVSPINIKINPEGVYRLIKI